MVTIDQKEAPVLREKSEPVNSKDFTSPRLKKILSDMATALEKEEDGVAIAAPQIGVPLRIFVVSHRAFEYEDEEYEDDPERVHAKDEAPQDAQGARPGHNSGESSAIRKRSDMVFINPVITKLSRKKKWLPEGCLSVRWLYGEVQRADKATVRAYDENGKIFTWGGADFGTNISARD